MRLSGRILVAVIKSEYLRQHGTNRNPPIPALVLLVKLRNAIAEIMEQVNKANRLDNISLHYVVAWLSRSQPSNAILPEELAGVGTKEMETPGPCALAVYPQWY